MTVATERRVSLSQWTQCRCTWIKVMLLRRKNKANYICLLQLSALLCLLSKLSARRQKRLRQWDWETMISQLQHWTMNSEALCLVFPFFANNFNCGWVISISSSTTLQVGNANWPASSAHQIRPDYHQIVWLRLDTLWKKMKMKNRTYLNTLS